MKAKIKILIGLGILAVILLIVFFYPKNCGGWTQGDEEKCNCFGIKVGSCPKDTSCDGESYYCFGLCANCKYTRVEYQNQHNQTDIGETPTAGDKLDLSISKAPSLNQVATLTFTIIPARNTPEENIAKIRNASKIILPEGFELVSREEKLVENKTIQITAVVKAVKTGNWTIYGGLSGNYGEYIYVSVSEDSAYISAEPFNVHYRSNRTLGVPLNESEIPPRKNITEDDEKVKEEPIEPEDINPEQITKEEAIAIANATDEVQEFLKLYENYISISVEEGCIEHDMECVERAGLCGCYDCCVRDCNCTKQGWGVHYRIDTSFLVEHAHVYTRYTPFDVLIKIDRTGSIISRFPDLKYIINMDYCDAYTPCEVLKVNNVCEGKAYNIWNILFYKIKQEKSSPGSTDLDNCDGKCINNTCVATNE